IDIGSNDLALLNFTSFEGATKRNRPNVKVGDLIYGLIVLTSKQLEPELSCVDSEGRARGMGLISAPGLVLSVSLSYARRLLSSDCKILSELSKQLKFETTVGMNGTIWNRNPNLKALKTSKNCCCFFGIGGHEAIVLAVRNTIIAGESTFDSNIALLVTNAVQNVGFSSTSQTAAECVAVPSNSNALKEEEMATETPMEMA
uniref:KH_dom_type_1 domain-containing protein n=1 Tax=Globodera pallida TaxID=36090 RepID=A0A183CRE8_GLOPA